MAYVVSRPRAPARPRFVAWCHPGLHFGDEQAASVLRNLYKMFIENDATLVEINPLAETPDGRGASWWAMDVAGLFFVLFSSFRCYLPPSASAAAQCLCATPS